MAARGFSKSSPDRDKIPKSEDDNKMSDKCTMKLTIAKVIIDFSTKSCDVSENIRLNTFDICLFINFIITFIATWKTCMYILDRRNVLSHYFF